MDPKVASVLQLLALLQVAALVLLFGAGLTASVAWIRSGLPAFAAELDATIASRSGVRRFLLGLVNVPVTLFLAAALLGRARPLSLLILLALCVLCLAGLAGELPHVGRIALDRPSISRLVLSDTLSGGALVTLTFLLPLFGQLFVLAFLIRAAGTGLFWILTRGRG